MVLTVEQVVLSIVNHLDETVDFTLEAPNDTEPFTFRFEPVILRSRYRDKNKFLRKGREEYTMFWTYRYVSHEMDIRDLLLAKSITLKAPPGFDTLSSFDVRLVNREALKNYLNNFPIASDDRIEKMPSGNLTLQFERTAPLTWNEMLSTVWTQGKTGLPAPGNVTASISSTQVPILKSFTGDPDSSQPAEFVTRNGANWTVSNGFLLSPNDLNNNGIVWRPTGQIEAFEYGIVRFKIRGVSGFNGTANRVRLGARVSGFVDNSVVFANGYLSSLRESTTMELTRMLNGGFALLGFAGFGYTDGVFYEFEIETIGSSIIGRIWESSDKTGTIVEITVTDANVTIGDIGLVINSGRMEVQEIEVRESNITLTEFNLIDWDAVLLADGYDLYMKKDAGEFIKQNAGLITDSQYQLPSLDAGSYEVFVRAVAGEIESANSSIVTFNVV